MARDKGRPQGYVPFLELYLRTRAEGGKVRVPGELRGPLDARARTACLVLVHGFNNTDGQAGNSYLGFRRRQQAMSGLPPFTYDRYFGDTFWPGDANYWWFLDLADFLVYPLAVKRAPEAAREIVRLLRLLPNLQRVDFVAHSLGCRVVLETLALLRDNPVPRVERVCLMAAAVPVEMLVPRGRFGNLLVQLQADQTRVHVLHSTRDKVVFLAFPPGQALAGEPSMHALGRDGPNALMSGYGSTLTAQSVPSANHGDYWGHGENEASAMTTRYAGEFLTLGNAERVAGTPRPTVPPMDVPEGRELSAPRLAFARAVS